VKENVWPAFASGVIVTVVAFLAIMDATGQKPRDINTRWRSWQCEQASATLANDTLCVRPDSSWRVQEPGR
jgi:hypothetical protein